MTTRLGTIWLALAAAIVFSTGCSGQKPPSGTLAPSRTGRGTAATTGGTTIIGTGGLSVTSGPRMLDDTGAPRSRVSHTVTAAGGHVVIIGGFTPDPGGPGAEIDIEHFDETIVTLTSVIKSATTAQQLQDGLMTSPGSMVVGGQTLPFVICWRAGHTANRLSSGNVAVIGGMGWDKTDSSGAPVQEQALASMHLYDPATKKFTFLTQKLTRPRFLHSTVTMPGDQLIVMGGIDAAGGNVDEVELIDFSSGTPVVTTYGTGPRGLLWAASAAVGNGACQWGGQDANGIPVNAAGTAAVPGITAENNTVVAVGNVPVAQIDAWEIGGPGVQFNNQLWVGGGITLKLVGSAFQYAPQRAAYLLTDTAGHIGIAGAFNVPRAIAGAAILNGSDILAAGGHDVSGQLTTGVPNISVPESESWDSATNQFSGRVALIQPRAGGVCCTLGSGRVLHLGGSDNSSEFIPYDGTPTEMLEIYFK